MQFLTFLRRAGVPAVAAVLVMSLGTAGPAGAVPAASVTPTMILLSPIPVPYGSMQALVQGTLEVQSSIPSQRLPIAGKTITISVTAADGTSTALGSAVTGPDGTFSLAVTLPALGLVHATFGGEASYAPYYGIRYTAPVYLPTRVTLDPLPATLSGLTLLAVTGSVQIQAPGGTWISAPGTSVVVHGTGTAFQARAQTDASGRFSAPFWIEDPGPYEADSQAGYYSFAGHALSASVPVDITPTPTRVTRVRPFRTPEIAQDGLAFTAFADAQATSGGSTFWTGANMTARLYFEPQGSSTWTQVATSRVTYPDTITFGQISAYRPDGTLAEGSWQVRVSATPVFQASQSQAITAPVRIQTWLNNIRLTKSAGASYLAGTLDDEPASGSLAGQAIRLYYQNPGSSRWNYVRTGTTSTAGTFALKLPQRNRWYRAVYQGAGNYLGITSTAIHLPN